MEFKNTRPTVIELADGRRIGPGEVFDLDEDKAKASKFFMMMGRAGYVVRTDPEAPHNASPTPAPRRRATPTATVEPSPSPATTPPPEPPTLSVEAVAGDMAKAGKLA